MEMLHGILLLIFSLSMGHGQECFVPGQCIDSDLLKYTNAANDIACLKDGQSVEECKWFTYKPQSNLCELFSNCLNMTTANCPGCTSGEIDCQPYQCEVTGSCFGHLIQSTPTSSYNQCLMECGDTDTCVWFTFDGPTNMCYLLTNCVSLDETCKQCMSGEVGCPPLRGGYTKIIIATGIHNGGSIPSVEVIDTSDRNMACNDLPPYDHYTYGATGGLLGTSPVFCGGKYGALCYSWVNDNWQLEAMLSADRYFTASAVVGNRMYVMGGSDKLDTSDMVGLDSSNPGPYLPRGVQSHCAVALNESTIMIIGGQYRHLPETKSTHYYHLDIDHWIKGPDLNTGRYDHSCATIKSNDQVTVVAAGGYNEASIELLTTGGESEWSYGNSLPVKIYGGQLVPDATGNGVLFIGGHDTDDSKDSDTIYHMACVECEWVRMTQTLKTARSFHVAIPVPDDLVTCQ